MGTQDILPARLRRTLVKLGNDISTARKKRRLTVQMLAERVGTSKATYRKVERGDPTVSMGVYAMTLFSLGFPDVLANLIDARQDDTGLLLDAARLPQRVRLKKALSIR